jgi:general secretion pathway protein E/type IV pilus assembly protein PilB
MNNVAATGLGGVLARTGLFNEEQIAKMLASRTDLKKPLIDQIIEASGYPEEKILSALGSQLGMPCVLLKDEDLDLKLRETIPAKLVFQETIFPIKTENGSIAIATCDPFKVNLVDQIRMVTGLHPKFSLAKKADIVAAQKKHYGVGADTVEQMIQGGRINLEAAPTVAKEDLDEGNQEASVVKFVQQIIWEAHQDRATDIHIEPMEGDVRIRYRVDGVLHQTPVPPHLKKFQSAIISRIKVMANMDIAERRLPQDGRINVRIKGEEIDVRVSTVPTVYGESVSLRLLKRSDLSKGLNTLGLNPTDLVIVERLVQMPNGIVLVTGPTGSGKSTSLYAFLNTINSVDQRIITIEEPIEYELPGVNQIQVKPEIDLTFARGLRHILRQDPDVIMVGEIRDLETAEIAIRASLTGHLVFSTLHTNDSAGGVTRLVDMGIEPYLLTSALEAIIAQRLVRTICPRCKEPQTVDRNYLVQVAFPLEKHPNPVFYHGLGCEECKQMGYMGRMGIYEILEVSEALRPLIIQRASSTAIKQKAISMGMKTLRDDGWEKVLAGITTVEEVIRVTQEDEAIVET